MIGCTGVSASWCPNCGDCCCHYDDVVGYLSRDDPKCPLHADDARHAETMYRTHLTGAYDATPLTMRLAQTEGR